MTQRCSVGPWLACGPAAFKWHWTSFRTAEKFDSTLLSYGTVQYFRSVHTELTNQVK